MGSIKEVALVCAGAKFDPSIHVRQIYQNLQQHCTDFRLTVFTDKGRGLNLPGVRLIQLPDWNLAPRQLWWYKLYIHAQHEWSGPVLYMDLDTIIIDNIDKFWYYQQGDFCICQDFNRQFIKDYAVSNSSIMRFDPGTTYDMYENFASNIEKHLRQFRGDQDYVTDWFKNRPGKTWWPREWAMSYKWEIKHGGSRIGGLDVKYPDDYYYPEHEEVIPETCSIVVFRGKPDPYDTDFGKKRLTVPV